MKITLTLIMGDKKQVVEGSSINSAISKFKKPDIIKARGSLMMEKDGKRIVQFPMNIPRLKMLFNFKKSYRDIFAKNLSLFLK